MAGPLPDGKGKALLDDPRKKALDKRGVLLKDTPADSPGDEHVESWTDVRGTPNVAGLVGQIFFPLDGATLDFEDRAVLSSLASNLRQQIEIEGTPVHIALAGRTDLRGPESYNAALGLRRAQAVEQLIRGLLSEASPRTGSSVLADALSDSPLVDQTSWLRIESTSSGEVDAVTQRRPELLANDRRVDIYSANVEPPPDPQILEENLRRLRQLLDTAPHSEPRTRLLCLMEKIAKPQIDDRYVNGRSFYWRERSVAFTQSELALMVHSLRSTLTTVWSGVTKSDESVLDNLYWIDERIFRALDLVQREIDTSNALASPRILQLRDWIRARQLDENSIYTCYR
jgi:hypothetical protein